MKKSQSIPIKSHFVGSEKSAEHLFRWKRVNSEIRDGDGQIVFQMKKVEAPEEWSQLAIDIAASKYFRRAGVPGRGHENSVRQLVHRVVHAIKTTGYRQGKYFRNSKDADIFAQELKYILLSQRGAFNSPVWFNAGLWELYHIRTPSEHFCWDLKHKKVITTHNAYERPQCSACFIQSIEDSIEGIFELAKTEAKLFKYGSGSGTNFSGLRSRYERISSGSTSSGLLSFLEVLDKGAGAIKSGGTTRRAAKMVTVDIDHPEIHEFIDWKRREEEKAKILIAAGYSSDLDGEAYRTISGQNGNNSVFVSDRFMRSLKEQRLWPLYSRYGRRVLKKVPSEELWKAIVHAAWSCADPALQFQDHVNRWHTCANTAPIRASNPCSEFFFLDDSACNLASINIVKFLNQDGSFDFDSFIHTVRILLISLEILVDYSSYPTAKIAQNSHDYRPLGLGFSNLGSFLMRLGVSYDSDTGRGMASVVTALLTGEAYATSLQLAKSKGAFAGYRRNKNSMQKVMRSHLKAVQNISWSDFSSDWKTHVLSRWQFIAKEGARYGFRNAQVTLIAPTGTISLLMDCDTTGIEPDFSLLKVKKIVGGGQLKLVNQAVPSALRKLGYSDRAINEIVHHLVKYGSLKECSQLKSEHLAVFACAMGGKGELVLTPESHLLMMAAVQPFISGAISKTVNLPEFTSEAEISRIYLRAWKLGLKSVAVYRDGCKASQPLSRERNLDNLELKSPSLGVKCPECHSSTILVSGCFRCPNCGTAVGCS